MRLRLALIILAVLALVVPLPPLLVERAYSTGLFPRIQAIVTDLSNSTAVAWFDVLIVMVGLLFIARAIADVRGRGIFAGTGRAILRLVTVASVAYLAFLLMWGLNYRREPLREKVRYDASRVTSAAALALARESVTAVNALYAAGHAQGWPGAADVDPRLVSPVGQALSAIGVVHPIVPGRPKRSVLDLYFRRAGVAGMTDPFFLETLVATDVLPFERPQVFAHEWAHLGGITDEGEANFVSWLACVRGTPAHQYSGWLFLYSEVVSGLPPDLARQASSGLADGPRADLRAIRERYQREVNPRISGAGWQVYDSYLKANRIEAGAASYAEVVQLVLGTGIR